MFGRIIKLVVKANFGLLVGTLLLTPAVYAQTKDTATSAINPNVKSTATSTTKVKTTTTTTPSMKTSAPTSTITIQPLSSVQLNSSVLQNTITKPAQTSVSPTVINGQIVSLPAKSASTNTGATTIVNGQAVTISKGATTPGITTSAFTGNGVLIAFQSNLFLSADANPTESSFGGNPLPNALQCTGVSPFDLHIYAVPAGQKTAALGDPPRYSIALSGCKLDSDQLSQSVVSRDYTEALARCAIMDGGCDFIWADKGPDGAFGEDDSFTIAKFE